MDNKTVAIVDDDLDDLLLMTDALTKYDQSLECKVFYTPEDVIESLIDERELVPQCIFIDINMPRINGIELLKRLRSNSFLETVKIIMLSTYVAEPHKEILMKAGANSVFIKPVSSEEYDEMLVSVFQDVKMVRVH